MDQRQEQKQISMTDNFRDEEGNLLFFCQRKIDSDPKIYLCIDGNDCSEGIVEEWDGTAEAIIAILNDYGYTALRDLVQTAFY